MCQSYSIYFSNVISKHSNRPKNLFNTFLFNAVINPGISPDVEASTDICEVFLKYFIVSAGSHCGVKERSKTYETNMLYP